MTTMRYVMWTSGFVDDVIFARNRRGKGDASRVHTVSDSLRAKSYFKDCLVLAAVVGSAMFWTSCLFNFHHLGFLWFWSPIFRAVGGATGKGVGLEINRSRVQILLEATLRNNLGQVVYTYVPLSPSSITWYRPKGGDALRLGR